MNIVKIKISLYIIWVLLLTVALIFVCLSVFDDQESLRIPGYVLICISSVFFLSGFFLDFRQTMIYSKTEGDEFTFMSKNSIITELKKRDVDFELDRNREYYIELIREYNEIAFEINMKKRENEDKD